MTTVQCMFVSDLHGSVDRYDKLMRKIREHKPKAVLMGGDLMPPFHGFAAAFGGVHQDFIGDFLASRLEALRDALGAEYPRFLVILGNDDLRLEEASILDLGAQGLLEYIHQRRVDLDGYPIYGYSFVPPTPFRLKDWERYDVSRFVDPGCVSPEEGARSIPVSPQEARWSTIQKDLDEWTRGADLSRAIFLFHTPPYQSRLDRAALDGQMIEYVPLDVHVGSIAVQRFIRRRQPLLTLHGHVHESARLTGSWSDRIGETHCFSAAHDGPELALVRFDAAHPGQAIRELV